MNHKHINIKSNSPISLVVVALVLNGCAAGPKIIEFSKSSNPTTEYVALESQIKDALSEQVNVLSPNHFKHSKDYLTDAKIGLDEKGDSEDILHSIAQGRAYLNWANDAARISNSTMGDVVSARKQASAVGAMEAFSEEFKDADESLMSVTSSIEKNDLKPASANRASLQALYLGLELKAIKLSALGRAHEMIELAKKDGASQYATQTLGIAQKSYSDGEAFINANRHDEAQIEIIKKKIMKNAQHALKITRNAKDLKNAAPEQQALEMESKQSKIDEGQSDLRAEQGLTRTLEGENESLESDRVFARKFESARTRFTGDEAEVSRQGNTLTIRLRGLNFPSGQAVVDSTNYSLLAKVQKVIKSFGDTTVVVEGHTDSNGGKKLNERLSSSRANAIREYLVLNKTINGEKIESVGYGYQKPLASNKSKSGRAQNRRVDILIRPNTRVAI